MSLVMAMPGSAMSNIRHSSKLLATQFLLGERGRMERVPWDNVQHVGGTRHLSGGAVGRCAHVFEVLAAAIQRLGSKSDPERKQNWDTMPRQKVLSL